MLKGFITNLGKYNEGELVGEWVTFPIDEDELDVGSSHPGAELGPKGLAVRQLKRHASWVQNVVRQFGPYPSWAQEF